MAKVGANMSFIRRASMVIAAGTLTVAGCASRSDNIAAAYVSPTAYASWKCGQIQEEASRLSARAAQVSGAQDSKATNDAVATGVGVVLFWPALFFIKGDSTTAAELSRLKGEMDAIEQVSIQKRCGVTFQRPAA
jgi:outer membrane murein-binding lipoprotein Lpp